MPGFVHSLFGRCKEAGLRQAPHFWDAGLHLVANPASSNVLAGPPLKAEREPADPLSTVGDEDSFQRDWLYSWKDRQ